MKNSFLAKLYNEGKINLIEPNKNIGSSYIEKSESNLISAKILLQNNRLEESVSLAYYSMYNILTALLFSVGIKCENHSASIILLKMIFNIDNCEVFNAKKERVDKQYYTDFSITKGEVEESIKKAEDFNKSLFDFIFKINSEDILKYRGKFDNVRSAQK